MVQALVAPAVALLLGCMIHRIWASRPDLYLRKLHVARRLPWQVLAGAALAELGSSCAEGRLHCSFGPYTAQAMVFEELVELLACLALVLAQAQVLGRHVGPAHAPLPAKALP